MTTSRNSLQDSIVSLQKSSSLKSSFEAKGSPEINLISFTHSNQCDQIASYLKKNPNIPIMSFNDLRCYTLMHIACLNNRSDIAKIFLDYLKRQGASDEEIKEWVNATTDEGFSAIHFASFKGSIILIKLLEEYGVDIHAKNNQGLNVLHIAAQGDQPVSLAYFVKKGMSLYELDQKGSTPLHWAAFMGMENATAYLISWGCELNLQDIESGHTPLHLAVLARSRRVVRLLLLKGADRHIKDNEGKTAREVALDNEYVHIAKLLGGRSWIVECLNVKPGLSRKRTRYSLAFFIGLFLLSLAGNVVVVLPYVGSGIWVILLAVFAALSVVFFLFAWLVNPGYMKNKKTTDILTLLLKYEPERVCPECMILRPERSKHCEYCGVCVAVFDHHCPWINNCVGARNHKYFLLFIFSTMLAVIYLGVLAFTNIGEMDAVDKYSLIKWNNTNLLFGIKEGVCAVNIILMLIFGVPLIMLNGIQMMNFIKGQTTNERFGYQGEKQETHTEPLRGRSDELTMSAEEDLRINENGRGKKKERSFVTNCHAMCCDNEKDPNYYYKKI